VGAADTTAPAAHCPLTQESELRSAPTRPTKERRTFALALQPPAFQTDFAFVPTLSRPRPQFANKEFMQREKNVIES
jgi:hypothetical protein